MLLGVRKIDAHSPEDENLWAESVLLVFLGDEGLVNNTLTTFFPYEILGYFRFLSLFRLLISLLIAYKILF